MAGGGVNRVLDGGDRTAMLRALDVIAVLTRAGLPLGVAWQAHPRLGQRRVDIDGQVLTGERPDADEVRAAVRAYAAYFEVEAVERPGPRQDSIHARAVVQGVRVDVWGVTAQHSGPESSGGR